MLHVVWPGQKLYLVKFSSNKRGQTIQCNLISTFLNYPLESIIAQIASCQISCTNGPSCLFFVIYAHVCIIVIINPLLHRLILDHDIIFYFQTTLKKFKKNLSKDWNTFENIMENGAFAPGEQMLHFP